MSIENPLNKYTCSQCGFFFITIDRDNGTTPFMMDCRSGKGCAGRAYSSFYRNVTGEPTYE